MSTGRSGRLDCLDLISCRSLGTEAPEVPQERVLHTTLRAKGLVIERPHGVAAVAERLRLLSHPWPVRPSRRQAHRVRRKAMTAVRALVRRARYLLRTGWARLAILYTGPVAGGDQANKCKDSEQRAKDEPSQPTSSAARRHEGAQHAPHNRPDGDVVGDRSGAHRHTSLLDFRSTCEIPSGD